MRRARVVFGRHRAPPSVRFSILFAYRNIPFLCHLAQRRTRASRATTDAFAPHTRARAKASARARGTKMSFMDARDVGSKVGSGGVASAQASAIDRRERLRRLALETIDLAKDPYFMKNHLGRCVVGIGVVIVVGARGVVYRARVVCASRSRELFMHE